MNNFRALHFRANHFASNQFAGQVSGDFHDGGSYWYKYWLNLHKKKKTLEEIIEAVKEHPIEALQAVPEVKKHFQDVDYNSAIAKNYEIQIFIAKALEIRFLEMEEEENAIEMLLLM
jgi:hypothetical protein